MITLAAGTLALLFAMAPAASAATITPNTMDDEFGTGTACSLREAIQAANIDAAFGGCPAGSGADTIPLQPGAVYVRSLTGSDDTNATGDLDILSGPLTIIGPRPQGAVIQGNGLTSGDRVLHIVSTGIAVSISGVTIRSGNAASGSSGGGIRSFGTLTLSDSTISANFTGGGAGGITNGGTANLSNVTISANAANGPGGGLGHSGATPLTTLNNVTVSGNTADADGNNDGDGGGISETSGTLNLGNTIVAGNTDATPAPGTIAPDCAFGPTSLGHNLIGNTAGCGYTPSAGDVIGVNALLGPLADNGGPAFTHALLAGSPAIDNGGTDSAPTDQRGVPRSSDIGAYERVTCAGTLVNRVGTDDADRLIGTEGADGFLLFAGDDQASALGGNDALCGDQGNDILNGGAGKDVALGADGNDKLNGGKGKDRLNGGKGKDRLNGGKGRDRLNGGKGKDRLNGGKGRDKLLGGKGRDRCNGGQGRDRGKSCERVRKIP